jgi:predicted GTPase
MNKLNKQKHFFEIIKKSHEHFKKDIERSVIVVGKTGAGKSNFLNQLLNTDAFLVSPSVESVTTQIQSAQKEVTILENSSYETIAPSSSFSYSLKCYDTPGIGDSKGRTKEIIKMIENTLKTKCFDKIVILIEYGRLDTCLYNYLDVLRDFLTRDLVKSNRAMLIINKMPTQMLLDAKRKRGEQVGDRDKELAELFYKISKALGFSFKYKLFLENDEFDEEINEERFNDIRRIIYGSSSIGEAMFF